MSKIGYVVVLVWHCSPAKVHALLAVMCLQVGLAQYTLRQYDTAEASFEAVRARDPYRLSCMDTYSNILYVKVCKLGIGLLRCRCLHNAI
jgi:hypothetical protein